MSVYCEDNHYGAGCDVRCEEHDDTTGHYTCDPKTGEKICMEGVYCRIQEEVCLEDVNCKTGEAIYLEDMYYKSEYNEQ